MATPSPPGAAARDDQIKPFRRLSQTDQPTPAAAAAPPMTASSVAPSIPYRTANPPARAVRTCRTTAVMMVAFMGR